MSNQKSNYNLNLSRERHEAFIQIVETLAKALHTCHPQIAHKLVSPNDEQERSMGSTGDVSGDVTDIDGHVVRERAEQLE